MPMTSAQKRDPVLAGYPSVGWDRDIYATTFSTIARVYVE